MRSVSPQSPLLAGELPPLAPSAYAPSPRKEGEEEEESTGGKTPDHTQPHSNAMRGEDRGFTEEERSVTGGERWRKTTVGKRVWRWDDWMIMYHIKHTPMVKERGEEIRR